MKIGVLKSKVEKKLLSSYNKGTFKTEIKNFKKNILENNELSKLFYLYDELNSNKGFTESFANEFLFESLTFFEKIYPNLKKQSLVEKWIKDVESENKYEKIDNFLYTDVTKLEEKILSKKSITETLKKKPIVKESVIKLPVSKMVEVANQTILNHINSMNESEQNELYRFLSQDRKEVEKEFKILKETVISKLNLLSENSDTETLTKIQETIQKVTSDEFNMVSFIQLKKLHESL